MRIVLNTICLALGLIFLLPLSAFSQTAQEFFEYGNNLYNQKKYAEAVASYGHAIQLQPISIPKAYLNCARAYSMLKDYPASAQYYAFYEEVADNADSDRKFKAEYNAIKRKARNESYVRDNAQTTILNQLYVVLDQSGPYMARQGNNAIAHYEVLLRSGYAEPELYNIQRRIVKGLSTEIEIDVNPLPGQPLPNLERTGWEYVRTKIARLRQFIDVPPDEARLSAIEILANAWEAYYRGDYDTAREMFEKACQITPALPAAYWGRLMLNFQLENNDVLLNQIAETEKVYQEAGITGTDHYFYLLRAQAFRNLGDFERSLEWLSLMQGAL